MKLLLESKLDSLDQALQGTHIRHVTLDHTTENLAEASETTRAVLQDLHLKRQQISKAALHSAEKLGHPLG